MFLILVILLFLQYPSNGAAYFKVIYFLHYFPQSIPSSWMLNLIPSKEKNLTIRCNIQIHHLYSGCWTQWIVILWKGKITIIFKMNKVCNVYRSHIIFLGSIGKKYQAVNLLFLNIMKTYSYGTQKARLKLLLFLTLGVPLWSKISKKTAYYFNK